jgi:hypothetical protein
MEEFSSDIAHYLDRFLRLVLSPSSGIRKMIPTLWGTIVFSMNCIEKQREV